MNISTFGRRWIQLPNALAALTSVLGIREALSVARTYYVRSDGSDANTGLADTAAGAFLTIQKAIDVVAATLDLGGFAVTIQARTGTFAGFNVNGPWVGGCSVQLLGDTATPDNVVINSAINIGIQPTAGTIGANTAYLAIGGFKLTAGLVVNEGSTLNINGNMNFAMTSGFHLISQRYSSTYINASYTISGGGSSHWRASTNGAVVVVATATITITGTPAFSVGFANVIRQSRIVCNSATFSGAATGPRYALATQGLIDTNGGGATFLPGNSAGTNVDGTGVYV